MISFSLARHKRAVFKTIQYFVMRHAIPLNQEEKEAFRHGPRIFANSIPKSGTNLLARMLNLLPGVASRWTYHYDEQYGDIFKQLSNIRHGQVITAHLPWSEELAKYLKVNKFKIILIIRDLRDVAWSNVPYVTHKDRSHLLHAFFNKLPSEEKRLLASIEGVDGSLLPGGKRSPSWGEHADGFLPWLNDPNCYTVRFEDLIGSAGGGDDKRQLAIVCDILRYLEIDLPSERVAEISKSIFSQGSRTFRKGKIGDWANHYTAEHKEVFKRVAGQALVAMGYEDSMEW
jgi:hypothetical protein